MDKNRANVLHGKIGDCRGIVESSDLPDDLCKQVTKTISDVQEYLCRIEEAADEIGQLTKIAEIADGIQSLHPGKDGGLGQWKELREALDAWKLPTKDTHCGHHGMRRHNDDGTTDCCDCDEQID